jgi:hypothetical protein
VDKDGKFYAISFASRQLKDHEKNYSPFLLAAACAGDVLGMDHFNEYLKGKKFIPYMDHKPLEKLGHLHSKTMNHFQTALLETTSLSSKRRSQTCRRTTYHDFQPAQPKQSLPPSILSRPTYQIYKERKPISRTYTTSTRIAGGRRMFPGPKPTPSSHPTESALW